MRSAPTRSAAVSLPSTIRAMRIHVVQGNRRSAGAGTSARSRTTSPKPPAWRISENAFSARAASASACPRGAHPQHARGQPARRRGRRIEGVARVDQRDRFAASRRGRQRLTATDDRPLDGAPVISDRCPRRRPPPSAASRSGRPLGPAARAAAPRRPGASVSVPSSLRARRRDSSAARISLFLRLPPRSICRGPGQGSRVAVSCSR